MFLARKQTDATLKDLVDYRILTSTKPGNQELRIHQTLEIGRLTSELNEKIRDCKELLKNVDLKGQEQADLQ